MSLLNELNNNLNIRKIFGKRELIIIEKQLNGVNLTQSEKNRLSRDIRKKFQAIKDLSKFDKEFGLKKGAIIKEKISEVVDLIKEDILFYKIKKIWIFGSSVEKTRTFRSDIDIAVEFLDIDSRKATEFRIRILKNFDKKMDVQVYNVLPAKIKKEIDEKGKVIYERKS